MRLCLLGLLLLAACSKKPCDPPVADLSSEMADAKRAQHVAQTELEILEQKVNRQINSQEDTESSLSRLESEVKKLRAQATASEKKVAAALKKVDRLEGQLAQRTKELRAALGSQTYTVQAGDSLEKIARKCGSTIAKIKQANNLTKDVIHPGQELSIPK